MQWKFSALVLTFLMFPAFAHAATAGFPDRSVWLSDATPTHGQKVTIYTVVYNATNEKINAEVTFVIDGASVASPNVVLAAGETKVVSAEWTAQSGNHVFGARFDGGNMAQVQETQSVAISVAEPPPPTALQQGVSVISNVASTSIPVVSTIAGKVYAATESFREQGIAFAESHIAGASTSSSASAVTKKDPTDSPVTLQRKGTGEQTNANDEVLGASGFEESKPTFFSRISQLAAPAILFTFKSKTIFYPLLLTLILLVLFMLGRWVNRPRF
ncbi:hypothetical protein HY970_03435 [Candidatus Kaiserbacteria bacterium]|nr:hypothetical protein [Candidatus Kaiserbacteria bacterium]